MGFSQPSYQRKGATTSDENFYKHNFGFLLGFSAFIFAVYDVTESVAGVLMFGSAAAMAVVLGGTIAATMIFLRREVRSKGVRHACSSIRPNKRQCGLIVWNSRTSNKMGKVGARDGLLALESEFKQIDTKEDPFLAHCIQLFHSLDMKKIT